MAASPLARRRAIQSYADLGRKTYEGPGQPAALVEVLLDALSDNLCAARRAVLNGRAEQRAKPLTRACMIIYGLYRSLDMRRSPTTAKRLADIYRYLLARINRINRKNGEQVLSELIGLVNTLRSAWSASPLH
jgi:flagellar protein FliS